MGSIQKVGNTNGAYLSIAGGNMVQKSEEGAEGAKKREYETSDGKTGVKWEIQYRNLEGFITAMEFKDGDYGEQFMITFDVSGNTYNLTMGTGTRYFADLAKKLPNVDLNKEVEINPFDFTTKEGKRLTGMSVKQDGEKVNSYYWDGKKVKNGLPQPEGDTKKYDSDDWKMYFITVKKFLKTEVEKLEIPVREETKPETSGDDISVEDIPF